MRLPIQLALTYPQRLQPTTAPLNLAEVGSLNFSQPDLARYPCLRLAMQAGETAGTYPAVMAAADEVTVQAFLDERVGFAEIPSIIEATLDAHEGTPEPGLEAIDAADAWARRFASERIASS